MKVDSCQAGAQEGGGCTEHVPELWLIIDYPKNENVKLLFLLASSPEMIIEKFTILMNFSGMYGMVINELKTKVMAINVNDVDTYDFTVSGIIVTYI